MKAARENELLCKIIAYNITVLISAVYAWNIMPVFEKKEECTAA